MRARCAQSNLTESTNQALVKFATRGTAMVFTVTVTFILLTAPTAVYMALPHVIQLPANPFYCAFMNFTQYLNHSINGLLYCIVGSRFRKQLLKLICRKERGEGLSVYPSVNNTSVVTISGSRTWLSSMKHVPLADLLSFFPNELNTLSKTSCSSYTKLVIFPIEKTKHSIECFPCRVILTITNKTISYIKISKIPIPE